MLSVRFVFTSLTLAGLAGLFAPACGGSTTNSAGPDGTGDPSNPTTTPASDLPCEVAAVLAKCTGCHSNPPQQLAPMPLVTYADLMADSPDFPGTKMAQRCLARMQDTTSPMPPSGHPAPSADEIAAFKTWLDGGAAQGHCDNPTAPIDAGPDPFAVAPTCTSMTNWTGGNRGSRNMRPGGACITCHKKDPGGEAPLFTIGGTVYPTAHEPDDCNAKITGTATVVITDANGKVYNLPVNTVGNFYYEDRTGTFKMPYKAKVVFEGRERVMTDAQTDGDCNSCHTQMGSKGSGTKVAPGRILLP